jgi:hypothetical protein
MLVSNNYFYKNRKSKLHFGDRVAVLNVFLYQTGGSRVLVSTEWENNFPLTMVEARDRNISDHSPLVVSTGASIHQSRTRPFRFKRGWFLRDDFYDMVANIWQSENSGSCPLERWQSKIHRLRQHLRGWASNIVGSYKKERKLF